MANDYNQADVSFVRMMIPHHQAAVDAAAKVFALRIQRAGQGPRTQNLERSEGRDRDAQEVAHSSRTPSQRRRHVGDAMRSGHRASDTKGGE